ncbi:MAG: hypothetical protein A2020_10975 [Lentisphaerae bacterium GWF2_45_14]|nr:MAG: hypothetical protein A2020_10975 [Lentisphaerae bacterium GWF2_45_14]
MKKILSAAAFVLIAFSAFSAEGNLLLNPEFDFHSFTGHREGKPRNAESGNVAYWNTDSWGDIKACYPLKVPSEVKPGFFVKNFVEIKPGKKMSQFMTLPEAGLMHGSSVSLMVNVFQKMPNAVTARIKALKLDSQDGEWSPADFGLADKRTFPKQSRGELVVAKEESVSSKNNGNSLLKIDNFVIPGKIVAGEKSSSESINTIALEVEFRNNSNQSAWVMAPSLVNEKTAERPSFTAREAYPWYRHIPRTIQKLWKGEAVHIIVMGSSIDRGSANPPLYLYNEDPSSPDFKKPVCDRDKFAPKDAGRPELSKSASSWSQHYFSYGGRLKLELMRKFNLTPDKVLINFMACDGSCLGEAHSGLKDYFSLSLSPAPNDNGHLEGTKWEELYPELFKRPSGPRPDLVIFGSGANEKTDTPDEIAVFEGMIRWIQRHYPDTEILFCMYDNGSYTPNIGDAQTISLRYQIPYLDCGRTFADILSYCNPRAFIPKDGHPQAAAHYVWFKQLEKAFECKDPIVPGIVQVQLPEQIHANSYGWEGEMLTFDEKSPRLKDNIFILEDTAVNFWASYNKEIDSKQVKTFMDAKDIHLRNVNMSRRDIRNSTGRYGNLPLGDRHVLEINAPGAAFKAVDSKICPDRRFFAADNQQWKIKNKNIQDFSSERGAPYGSRIMILAPGEEAEIDIVGTDISIAYLDFAEGGTLELSVNGKDMLKQPTNIPFKTIDGRELYMENRKGIIGLGYGWHKISVRAAGGPVKLFGIYSYDSRSGKSMERVLRGNAVPGEKLSFSLPFRNRPFLNCSGGLAVSIDDVTPGGVNFSGNAPGSFEIIGE